MELLTNSRMAAFRRCPRLHYYRYEARRRPIKRSTALGFGTIFHAGLEAWWRAHAADMEAQDPLESAFSAVNDSFADEAIDAELSTFDLIKAQELMRGYHWRWGGDSMHDMQVLGVESEFEMPLRNPATGNSSRTYRLGGKLDGRVKILSLGKRMGLEHKTTTSDISPGSVYWERLRMDSQVSTYYEGAAHLGDNPQGFLYDVIRRPTIKPLQATPEKARRYTLTASKLKDGTVRPAGSLHANQRESDENPVEFRKRLAGLIAADPDAYYQRGEVVRLGSELEAFRFDLWEQSKSLRERQLAGRTVGIQAWPRDPGACDRWGRLCEYWGVCTGSASIDDSTLFRDAVQHEELIQIGRK